MSSSGIEVPSGTPVAGPSRTPVVKKSRSSSGNKPYGSPASKTNGSSSKKPKGGAKPSTTTTSYDFNLLDKIEFVDHEGKIIDVVPFCKYCYASFTDLVDTFRLASLFFPLTTSNRVFPLQLQLYTFSHSQLFSVPTSIRIRMG